MRRFGRQCRGQGKVFVSLVRQTETRLLETGQLVVGLARTAQACVQSAVDLAEEQRRRLVTQLTVALEAHHQIATQSRQLTNGKPLRQCKLVNAHDLPIAPICKGKSNCPTQFGRKPGIIAAPASGFIFAFQLPVGNPRDASYVVPLVDKVQTAIAHVAGVVPPRPFTRWPAIWRSMTPRCARPCMAGGSSRWAVPIPLSPSPRPPPRRRPSRCCTRLACSISAPRPKCSSPAPVVTAARWSKASRTYAQRG
jgi:hypothetical protein